MFGQKFYLDLFIRYSVFIIEWEYLPHTLHYEFVVLQGTLIQRILHNDPACLTMIMARK